MKQASAALALLAAVAALSYCKDATAPAPKAARIIVSPDSISIHTGQLLQMHLLALDSAGDTVSVDSARWTSSDTAILTVSAAGLVTAHHYGVAQVSAQLDSLTDSARLRVLVPVAVLGIEPNAAELVPGGTLHLSVKVHGIDGSILSDRDVAWIQQDGIFSISADGMLKVLRVGEDRITAVSEGVTASIPLRVTQPSFVKVVADEESMSTCALTDTQTLYCWGANESGELGNGTYGDSTGYVEWLIPTGIAYPTGVPYFFSPVTDVVTNDGMTCAAAGQVFCWGNNDEGSLGVWDISSPNRPGVVPRLSATITSVVAGSEWGCGLGADSIAYCWGGSVTGFLIPPEPISTRKYLALAGGYSTLCGLGTDSLAYCGFPNVYGGQLVSASIKFTRLAVGYDHQCGVATDSAAYCWGQNGQGQLGDTTGHLIPGPVMGGLRFIDIAAGFRFTCGLTVGAGEAYCWGQNAYGVLGRSGPASNVPLLIPGNIAFIQITAGRVHACGVSIGGKVYCWGGNASGQLGDGTSTDRTSPVLVTGQQP